MMQDLHICIPKSYESQISYSLYCLLQCFLGVEYSTELHESDDVEIKINNNSLTINNEFLRYCKSSYENIDELISPNNGTIDLQNGMFPSIALFGKNELQRISNKLVLKNDIIGATFLMLSRCEESRATKKDKNGRFLCSESIAYKFGFIDRPIVNEYVELLWAIFKEMGIKQDRKIWEYKLVPTHDVDIPFLFNGIKRGLRSIAGYIMRRKFGELTRYLKLVKNNNDPFDTYDLLMSMSEKRNTQAHFFFLQKGEARQDENHNINDPKIKMVIENILDRGHHVGFHPSYNTYNDNSLFKKEKDHLQKVCGQEIETGRHHFLRWDVMKTPKIWNDNNMKWDSTLGFADHAGFRCGVCYPFPLFDLENNRQLDVYERPLIAMEWSLIHYQGLNIEESEKYIQKLKTEIKKYNGEFVFLYHNSSFFTNDYVNVSDRLLTSLYN